ncbi:MAG: hypothetical protein OJF62_002905 [Pseudolabrys sp.]|nr:hypothetical protein [Pseudolabrys sp.]
MSFCKAVIARESGRSKQTTRIGTTSIRSSRLPEFTGLPAFAGNDVEKAGNDGAEGRLAKTGRMLVPAIRAGSILHLT